MDETVSVRIPSEVLKDLEGLSERIHQSRSDVLRDVLNKGLERKKVEVALSAYKSGQASLGKARELAGIPLHRFLDELRQAGILQAYSVEDLRADLGWAKSG